MISLRLIEGNFYYVKNDFFKIINEKNFMTNHGEKADRPLFLAIIDKKLLWLVPLSSRIEKYKKILVKKELKYGRCDTIMIAKIFGKENAILIQNTFPCLQEFIDHEYKSKMDYYLSKKVIETVRKKLNILFKMKENGVNLFMVDIDKIIDRLYCESSKQK